MKKTISLIVAISFVLFMFAGCNGADEKQIELSTFESENGYTVSYPEEFEPTKLSEDIDFVIMDTVTGSVVSIQTDALVSGIKGMTQKDFKDRMKDEGMEITVNNFSAEPVNGNNALIIEYEYKENNITQIIYDAGDKTYSATYTELPGTDGDLRAKMTAIIRSLTY